MINIAPIEYRIYPDRKPKLIKKVEKIEKKEHIKKEKKREWFA